MILNFFQKRRGGGVVFSDPWCGCQKNSLWKVWLFFFLYIHKTTPRNKFIHNIKIIRGISPPRPYLWRILCSHPFNPGVLLKTTLKNCLFEWERERGRWCLVVKSCVVLWNSSCVSCNSATACSFIIFLIQIYCIQHIFHFIFFRPESRTTVDGGR